MCADCLATPLHQRLELLDHLVTQYRIEIDRPACAVLGLA
jgi:hypothetical protein